MAKNRSWNYRQYKRYVKGMKRLKVDQAEHGNPQRGVQTRWNCGGPICECFEDDAVHGRGKLFAVLAERPRSCSCFFCTNVNDHFHFAPTLESEDLDENGDRTSVTQFPSA